MYAEDGCQGPTYDWVQAGQARGDADTLDTDEPADSQENSEEHDSQESMGAPSADMMQRKSSLIKDQDEFRRRIAEIEAANAAARRQSMGPLSSLGLHGRFVPMRTHRVRFTDLENRNDAILHGFRVVGAFVFDMVMRWLEAVEHQWAIIRPPLVVMTGIFELWSMGIWIGFLTEPKMAEQLRFIAIADVVCNILYIADSLMSIGTFYMEERRIRRMVEEEEKHSRRRQRETLEEDHRDGGEGGSLLSPWSSLSPARQNQLKVYFGLVLAVGMVPVQFLLWTILLYQRYEVWQVLLVLVFRFLRVVWGFRACASLINQQELEVYVDIRMHGTSGSGWNRVRILTKQFLVVAFFGHWFGCLSYGVRKIGSVLQNDIRVVPDTTRDYFSQYRDRGNIAFEPGEHFWESYLLALYKGFNLNVEDILPERPMELIMEVFISMMILLMKSYCIGGFFKFHQRREFEVQRFRQLMVSVTQYLDLYEVPPSLRKAVVNHFRFQQSNHRKMQTLEVISKLPAEVRKKLREQEVLPTVVDRNPSLFGTGLSRDFCVQISMAVSPRYLQPSEVIFMELEVPRELVFLESGAVALSRGSATEGQRTEQLLRYVRADRKDDATALGAVSLILGTLHFYSARVRAGNEAVTLNLPRDEFEDMKLESPDQWEQLVRNVQETYGAEAEQHPADENERFASAYLVEVRKALQTRQDSLNATFTYAASKGDVKLVQDLLRKRMDPNVADYDRRSALHLAASEGMSEVLEAILEANGDGNMQDRWGSTPLQDALKGGYVGAAKIVHKHGGRLDLADPAAALCGYASEGNTFAMQQLIDFRVDPNVGDYDSRTALHLSASEGHLPVVTFLTMRKADVNAKDRWKSTPIQDAIRNGYATVASHLRAQGGRVDSDFVANQLCDAASTGDLPMLKMLFETGVDVNQGDYDARTALHLAAAEGQVLALNYLVNTAQALHSPVDRWGSTPLQDALTGGHTVCVQLLLSCGAGLGPSADKASRQTVENLATEMGFRNGGISTFSEASGSLRRRLRAHMDLVEKHKARADIFNMEEAQRFNMQVVIAAFGRVKELKEQARWIIQLLQQLEPASQSTWQLLRLLRDGVGLVRESKLWSEAAMLDNVHKRRKDRRSTKDASDMAFHGAFLACQRFVPLMQTTLTNVTNRVLTKVRASVARQRRLSVQSMESRDSDRTADGEEAGPRAPLSMATLVVNELFSELGWAGDTQQHKVAKYAGSEAVGGGAPERIEPNLGMTRRGLTTRLEQQAMLLLPAEHLAWTLLSGPLKLQGSGAAPPQQEQQERAQDPLLRSSVAFETLRPWLERRTGSVLSGKPPQADQPPVLPAGAKVQEVFVCLWPAPQPQQEVDQFASSRDSARAIFASPSSSRLSGTLSAAMSSRTPADLSPRMSVRRIGSRPSAGSLLSHSPRPLDVQRAASSWSSSERPGPDRYGNGDDAIAYLVAYEMVVMAMTALINEGWDQGSRFQGGNGEDDQANQRPVFRRGRSSQFGRKEEKQTKLTQEDFQELGAIFRRAAKACRGREDDAERLAKKAQKAYAEWERRGTDVSEQEVEDDKPSSQGTGEKAAEEAAVENVEQMPIRLAKIMALQDKMSIEELALLMDADDSVHWAGGSTARAFGELSRDRFSMNLLRCIIDHESTHADAISRITRKRRDWEFMVEYQMAFAPPETMSPMMESTTTFAPTTSGFRHLRVQLHTETLSELYEEADRLHEALSQGSGEGQNITASFDDASDFGGRKSARKSAKSVAEDENDESKSGFWFWRRNAATAGSIASKADLMEQGKYRKATSTASANGMRGSTDLGGTSLALGSQLVERRSCRDRVADACRWLIQFCGAEGRERRKRQRIAKRFKELDDDGEGIGTAEVAQLFATAYRHTLGADGELRWAYRTFELLNKADVGDLVTLPEFLSVLPKLQEEIKAQQRKNQNRREVSSADAAIGPVARCAAGLVFTPDSLFGYCWDEVRKAVVVYYMFEVPMRFCFLSRDRLPEWATLMHLVASSAADAFMGLNIIFTFFRSFVHPTLGVISAFQDIRMHYLLGRFPIDLIACVPVDWWVPEENGESGLFARPRATIRLLKLLHMHHLRRRQRGGTLEATSGFYGEAWAMSLAVWTLVHFLACVWWLVGTRYPTFDPEEAFNQTYTYDPQLYDGRGSWTFSYHHRPGENPIGDYSGHTPYWWQYLASYYVTIGKVTSQSSSGNVYAGSWLELAWFCVMFPLSVAVNGYCDGILVDKVIAGDEQFIEGEAMRRILDEYLNSAELPLELAQEVRSSAKLSSKMVAWRRMEETISALPHSLQQRVARRTVMPRIMAQEIFTHCSESFLVELGTHFRILAVGAGQILARPGEPASQLAILNFGRVAALDQQGNTVAETSTPLDMIEEVPFIFNLTYNILVTVMEETQLTVLRKKGFNMTCRMYPEDSMTLRRSMMKAVQVLTEEVEDGRGDEDGKSRATKGVGAKSTLSFGTSASKQSKSSSNGGGLNTYLRRGHARELKLVAEKLREEEAAARQDVICKFIQCAADGEVANVSSMLTKGEVFVDEGDYDQRTALHLAVCNGHLEVVRTLIEQFSASVQVKDRFSHTPVEDAVREKKVDILRYIVGRGAQYQADTNVAAQLCQAAHDADIATLKLLLEIVGCNPNSQDYDKRTALHLAASEGHIAVVELLCNAKNIEVSLMDRLGNTPLDDAMRHKHVQVRRYLHSKGARMGDRNMGVALCSLASEDDVEGLRDMADSEVDLNQGDYDARTALHLAASENRLSCATYLLIEAGVDPNPLDRFLSTPLDDAIRHRHAAMEALLRDVGGLRGSDPQMAGAVAKFKEEKVVQEAQALKRRLEKEVQQSEVSTIMANLKRFREHPTMEDDVYSFVTHSANFRDLLLRLLSWSTGPIDPMAYGLQSGQEAQVVLTKNYRDQLLTRTCADLEDSLGRLVAVLEGEVLPWLGGLSKAEARLLGVLVPDLKPAVTRILEQMRGGARLRKFVKHLWNERGPGGGCYQCLPVGLLLQRRSAELGYRVRLEAEALLWSTGTSAGQRPVHAMIGGVENQERKASTDLGTAAPNRVLQAL